ncbi:MAG: hypothetical protein K2O39_02495, partial [Clostridiales bacterium]|nr:hypothetical protein [Clostridiales bacterium]
YLTDAQKSNYYFYYGNVTDDDEIKDANKGLSITQRTEDSFVLSKHWFIAKYASLFVATDDTANYPYVPFHDNDKIEAAGGVTNISGSNVEGANGETNTATDTVTYTDALTVKIPVAKFNSGFYDANNKEIIKDGTVKFDVIYVDLDGKTHRIANQVTLDATGSVTQNTLPYYFNQTMPAGRYTLKLYGEIAQSAMNQNPADGNPRPNKIQGEYWLTVLPAQLDSSLITGANGIQDIIKGEEQDNGEFLNSYLLSEKKLHDDLSAKITELNGTLNKNLSKITSYWNNKAEYFDGAVTVKYNREGWSSSNYVTENEMKQMLTQAGTYQLYYSISAKNYVTVGGPDVDDATRQSYGFVTRLSEGVSIKQIYDRLNNANDPYFKNVTYTGSEVHTLVPYSSQYASTFDDTENYIDVRERASVTLTLESSDVLTGWEDDGLPEGVLGEGKMMELSADRQKLTVYFDIVPAINSFTVAPQMSPWTYGSYK